ncbi:MAG: ABC transporter ATP-binding protein [Alphaproteobacteria bacterium]|nr:ABC transporter ATP-binding protein [Alphaproteobacteria bacterium]
MSALPAHDALLSLRGLTTVFPTRHGEVRAADGVDLDVRPGECLGVVGESGSGKTVTFLSVLDLVRRPGRIEAGTIVFDGRDLRRLPPEALRAIRGRDIAMTMQDALTALNPAFTVGAQIAEVLEAHGRATGRSALDRAVQLLEQVGVPDPARRVGVYPHQLSGGLRQRAMIAAALACQPRLLIADEPTTALDVTIQAQVLDLIADMRQRLGMSVVLITHDLGIVAERCDRVVVMYAGQVVESGPTRQVIGAPAHPYTAGLLASMPRLNQTRAAIRPIEGQIPDPARLPPGCRFEPRCPRRRSECLQPVPMRDIVRAERAFGARAVRCVLAGAAP